MSFSKQLPVSIIKKAQKGDKFAIAHIYHEFKSPIYSMAYRILLDKAAAEDVLHQVIEKVMLKISSLKEARSFNGWLKAISYHTAIDYVNARTKEVELDTTTEWDQVAPKLVTDMQESSFDVMKYLASLNERERLVVIMFLVEGYTHNEVAQTLGISESNSKQIYRRALLKLNNLSAKGAYSGSLNHH